MNAEKPFPTTTPLSLYVHLPWCERKCPYCDFNSFETRGPVPEADYIGALLRDLDAELLSLSERSPRPLVSIFIGGGTPSLFSGAAIHALLEGIRHRLPLSDACEITLEANPGTAEAERFMSYREAGINRLSIGIQSFRDEQLARLGRVHSVAEAKSAVESAQASGFDNVNLDLMYGLPGDDVRSALFDLESLLELGSAHLSWYQLTLEPNTAFHRRPPALPDDDTIMEIEHVGRSLLDRHGFERYEISAYARAGRRCTHNVNYWRFGDYLGIGAGAHGKLTDGASGVIQRRAKLRNPRMYLEAAGSPAAVQVERTDAPDQIIVEFMMNALRLTDGVDVAHYENRTCQPRERIRHARTEAEQRGWLLPQADVLCATPTGLQLLNRLLALF